MSKDKLKVGLMLGGGGAKGAYQLGVIKALEEAKLLKHINSISGVSIGAINTLLLMSNKKYQEMSKIWEILDNENVFGTRVNQIFKKNRLYDFNSVAQNLVKHVNLKDIKKSKYNGYATAALIYDKESLIHQIKTDTMKKHVFHLNKFEDPYLAAMASSSIPVVFGPTKINGKNYVDGGVIDNYPIQPLIDDGCNLIFTVALDDWFNPHLYNDKDINIINFTSTSAFEKSRIKDILDIMKFNDSFKMEKEELGYQVGQLIIEKMKNNRYIKRKFGFTYLKKKSGFRVLEPDKTDEMYITILKKEKKLSIKRLMNKLKIERKMKKGSQKDE
ncbi:patatin-like phospholipase family protein [Acholeplasma granularum]|uniref:patatin-like phospholipase family protein n=1 Tax=Acholeplasma granularum TaxID=264635 RepID=UPI0004BA6D42|nr:patatin-like phospholipase family protein [Acholeplasma granularum]